MLLQKNVDDRLHDDGLTEIGPRAHAHAQTWPHARSAHPLHQSALRSSHRNLRVTSTLILSPAAQEPQLQRPVPSHVSLPWLPPHERALTTLHTSPHCMPTAPLRHPGDAAPLDIAGLPLHRRLPPPLVLVVRSYLVQPSPPRLRNVPPQPRRLASPSGGKCAM